MFWKDQYCITVQSNVLFQQPAVLVHDQPGLDTNLNQFNEEATLARECPCRCVGQGSTYRAAQLS